MTFSAELYQYGIVTDDLEATMGDYDALGAVGWKRMDTCYQGRWRDWSGEVANRNAFAMWQGLCLELIEPGRGHSTAREWLDRRGRGVFHLGFITDDLTQRPFGAEVCFESFGRLSAAGGPAVIHLDTVAALGYFIELSDRPLVESLMRWVQSEDPAIA